MELALGNIMIIATCRYSLKRLILMPYQYKSFTLSFNHLLPCQQK